MRNVDLNLLTALDALLSERSVSAAARKLGLSTSAMSRTLSRLRDALGDPLLVPAGRTMVPTPHAEALAGRISTLAAEVHGVLRPPLPIDIRLLDREFIIRANEAFTLRHAARLCAAISAIAPDVRLRFMAKPDKDIGPLRDATVDLDIGVVSGDGGELRSQTLYRDAFAGLARIGHPLLDAAITPERYAACDHVVASRRRHFTGPVDAALADIGLSRRISVIVPSFPAVIAVVSVSDLIGLVPRSACPNGSASGIELFDLPLETPEIVVSQIWHPRMDADAGHRWLRGMIFDAFREFR